MHPISMQVTVRPLSPSSGRVRQAPPCRRVRSIDNLDRLAGARPHSPPKGDVQQATPCSPQPTGDQEPSPATTSGSQKEVIHKHPQLPDDKAAIGNENVFGEAAKSWGRICSEMAKTSAKDFDVLQNQLNAFFIDEKGSAITDASAGEDGRAN